MYFIADPEHLRAIGPLYFCAAGAGIDLEVEVSTWGTFFVFFLSHAVEK